MILFFHEQLRILLCDKNLSVIILDAFTVIDQNRDGIIDKDDLRDTFGAMGRLNVKNEELDAMIKEASGPINFTVFLTMFGEKLKGADPEDVIMSAFKVLDPDGKGTIKKQFLEELLSTQCDRFTPEEVNKNMWHAFLQMLLQRGLQEHLLPSHTERTRKGNKPQTPHPCFCGEFTPETPGWEFPLCWSR
uniref:Uncharacterized protein n=1 Tax=Sphaerodactylus townsendi TaxID=933632 RepID=A0ACB8EVZ8_9SAUR